MLRNISRLLDAVSGHYRAVCMFLALAMMTIIGVGDIRIASMAGFLLCIIGFAQHSAEPDLWIFVPLVCYNIASMASSYAAYGNITVGYGGMQMLFPVVYLLMTCLGGSEVSLLKRLCVAWVGFCAAWGVAGFVARAALEGRGGRLDGVLGNPNATGIFLVMGWFMLLQCLEEIELDKDRSDSLGCFLPYLEPVLFFALALTLSMGSFVSMAAGIAVLLFGRRKDGLREMLGFAFRILAKAVLGIGTGLLLYLGASRTNVPWICVPLAAYAGAVVLCWRDLERFLKTYGRVAAGIAMAGVLVAGTMVAARSGSFATFSERLEMMGAALPYLKADPLLGVGPYQWRLLDMQDGGKYFNTWHIHNVLLHVGVEFGWIAAAMLVVVAVRFYRKKKGVPTRACFTAYCVHNMMDTSFFYMGVTTLAVIMAGEGKRSGKRIGNLGVKVIFGLLAGINAVHFLYYSLMLM